MSRLLLASPSSATDSAWRAAADVSAVAAELALTYRLVGGISVTLLTHHHQVQNLVPARETADADVGVPRQVCAEAGLVDALERRSYQRTDGSRFERPGNPASVIDILTVSRTGRREALRDGHIVADGLPGMHTALMLPASRAEVTAVLTDGTELELDLNLPDVLAALVLKGYSYADRFTTNDAIDVWRLLEAANAAGRTADDWPTTSGATAAAVLLHRFFGAAHAPGAKKVSARGSDQARARALTLRVVPQLSS